MEAFLQLARERFQLAQDAEFDIRDAALEDLRFRIGDQWPEHLRAERAADRRPTLTVNRLPQFLKQICNEQRQNRPAIQVSPVDDHSDPETAEIMQGMTRHIEAQSSADVAYDTAFEFAATMGFGWFRILTDYCDEESFDLDARIEAIQNPFTVYIDPAAKRADRSDMQWAFVIEDILEADYKAQYPDSELAGLPDMGSIGDRAPAWLSGGFIRVAEYFRIETQRRTLCLLADGSKAFEDELPEGVQVVRTRPVDIPTVKWSKINAVEELEASDFPSKYIPLVPVLGDEINVDGKRHLIGIIRYAKDAQRAYNYWTSAKTEMIALAPRAPYIGAEGQFEGHEAAWSAANSKNLAFLQYKRVGLNGELAPPPQRQNYEPPIQAISMALAQATDDLKATTGIYDASLGAQGNEQSGRAILARQQEGDTANFHFLDNLARSIRHCGRILIDMIPRVYDTPRVTRIIGEDQAAKTVQINAPFAQGGKEKIFDLSVGKYDVTVAVGPSYASKRQQAVEAMLELTKAYPQLAEIAGDLLVSNMDWPGAKKIAERLKKLLPPQLQDEGDDGAPQIPPQAQKQLAEQGGLIEQLTATLTELQNEIDTKKVEMDSRERIVAMQEETKVTLKLAELNQAESLAILSQELQTIKHRLEMSHANEQQENQRTHEAEQAAAAREQEAAAAAQMPIAA